MYWPPCLLYLLSFRTYLIYLCCYLFIMVAGGSRVVNGLKCYCNPNECDIIRDLDCPGKGIMFWDPCKCCRICAKTLGDVCGGPGDFSGQCEPPLQCVTKLPIANALGTCMYIPYATELAATSLSSASSARLSSDSSLAMQPAAASTSFLSSAQSIFSSPLATYHQYNCTKAKTITVQPGCAIISKRCKCWPKLHICKHILRNSIIATPSSYSRWRFKSLADCQLNLHSLIQIEMDFDEDYTEAPSTFTYKKLRRKLQQTDLPNEIN